MHTSKTTPQENELFKGVLHQGVAEGVKKKKLSCGWTCPTIIFSLRINCHSIRIFAPAVDAMAVNYFTPK